MRTLCAPVNRSVILRGFVLTKVVEEIERKKENEFDVS